MKIDANMYWLPEKLFEDQTLMEEFLEAMPSEFGWYGYAVDKGDRRQIVIEKPKGYQNLNYVQGEYELEQQLRDLDEAGMDKAVLKLPGCHEWMTLSLCHLFNDLMAEHGAASHGRLIPTAVIPPMDTQEVIEELTRCRDDLGMKSIQLCAHYGDRYLDHPDFDGFFRVLNDMDMTVYIHHTPVPVQYDFLYEYNNLRRSYGRCVDQTTAVIRELYSGMFGKYPKLRFVHSMLGGGFFSIANMIFPHKPKGEQQVARFETENQEIRTWFRENIFFELSHAQPWGKKQLECAVEVLGADHLLFGTSYPVNKDWLLGGDDFIQQLDLTEQEKLSIMGGNAARLYKISID